ncbi:hypothetical protein U1Q18_023447 [Sarracenia purpurea var. burkii]
MASGGGGGGHRSGIHKGTVKVDRPVSAPSNLRSSSSFKAKLPPAATVRRSSPASLGVAAKNDDCECDLETCAS